MDLLHAFDLATLPAMPWKNGGGTTREIARWPLGCGLDDFHWRASVAEVAQDGPFSGFPGVDRVIALLDGPGLHLQAIDGRLDHRLDQPLQPFAFDGERALHARLLGGPSVDFNLMTRRSVCHAQVQVLRRRMPLCRAPQGLLLAVHGPWRISTDCLPERVLAPGQGLWWSAPPGGAAPAARSSWRVRPATPASPAPSPTPAPAALLSIAILPNLP